MLYFTVQRKDQTLLIIRLKQGENLTGSSTIKPGGGLNSGHGLLEDTFGNGVDCDICLFRLAVRDMRYASLATFLATSHADIFRD